MALLERVSTLVRANLNDLIDKAEHPEKMIKQVIIDMQNQLLQLKTQVAIAIADQHLLAKKALENEDKQQDWMRKAELAVEKKDDALARAALDRALANKELAENFHQQVGDQKAEVESLKSAFSKLEGKLGEAQAKSDLLLALHRGNDWRGTPEPFRRQHHALVGALRADPAGCLRTDVSARPGRRGKRRRRDALRHDRDRARGGRSPRLRDGRRRRGREVAF